MNFLTKEQMYFIKHIRYKIFKKKLIIEVYLLKI